MSAFNPEAQNWQAFLQLNFRAGQDKTNLVPVKRYGPLSVQRPFYPERETCHVYLLHPPGGVVGGDRLELHLDLEAGSKALLTTPGATKFYRSAGECAEASQHMQLQAQAELEYLPQENIYFPGALVKIKTVLDVNRTSHAILWEKHCFGRPANNETFDTGKIVSRLELHREDKLLFTETQRVDSEEIKRVSGLRSQPVMATLLVYSENLNARLIEALRKITPAGGYCGITCPLPECLIARYFGGSTDEVNAWFMALLDVLRPVVLNRPPCHPRIWNT